MSEPLTARERAHLKARAHALEPVVHVGGTGVTDGLIAEIDRALTAHELIKVKIGVDDRAARIAIGDEVCDRYRGGAGASRRQGPHPVAAARGMTAYRRTRPRMQTWARGGIMIVRVAFGAALHARGRGARGTLAQSPAASDALLGRWDLVVQRGTQTSPSWLEVERSGTATLVGQFVGSGGSARPIAKIEFTDGTFRFAIPPQWESNPSDITFEGRLEGDRLTGSMTMGDGQKVTWSGTRAPSLRRAGRPAWGEPVTLFNGKSLDGWQPVGRGDSQWSAAGGVLQNAKSGANLVTAQKFDDFKLHLEFRVPKGANSGVYLRGRYELQIDDAAGLEPSSHHLGGRLRLHCAERERGPGGRRVAVDGRHARGPDADLRAERHPVICNREIPGITGGALDSAEADPDRCCLQGDHGPVDYRNIVITPAKK